MIFTTKRPLDTQSRLSKCILFATLGFWMVFTPGCSPRFAEQGWNALNRGELDKARKAAQRGVKQHSNSRDIWDLKLRTDLLSKDWDSAVESFKNVRRLARNRTREKQAARRLLAAQTLWAGLVHEDVSVRRASAKTAARLGADGLQKTLSKVTRDEDRFVRVYAYAAMLPETFEGWLGLMKLSHDLDPLIRQAAVANMARVAERDYAFDVLLRLAEDPNPCVRSAALNSIAAVTPKDRNKYPRALTILLDGLKDPAGRVRSSAAFHLSRKKPGAKVNWAENMLQDPELSVRLAAFRVLEKRDLSKELLKDLARSEDLYVAFRASVSLVRRRILEDCGYAIKRGISSTDWRVRVAALNAASSMRKCSDAADITAEGLKDPDPRVRMAAARAAFKINRYEKEALSVLLEALKGTDKNAVRAAELLALENRKEGLKRLEELPLEGDVNARIRAVEVLGRLKKNEDAVLRSWAEGPWDVRLAVVSVLWNWK